jgi:hypothetical protein
VRVTTSTPLGQLAGNGPAHHAAVACNEDTHRLSAPFRIPARPER